MQIKELQAVRAVEKNDVALLAQCLQAGVGKEPLLLLAARTVHKEVVELLINSKADVNYADGSGYSALMTAAWNDQQEVCRLLLEAGAGRKDEAAELAKQRGHTELGTFIDDWKVHANSAFEYSC